jgi:hypothetical protein
MKNVKAFIPADEPRKSRVRRKKSSNEYWVRAALELSVVHERMSSNQVPLSQEIVRFLHEVKGFSLCDS